jgi:hypothetical protein
MKKHAMEYMALAAVLVLAGVFCPSVLGRHQTFDSDKFYTWGIDPDTLKIPDGSIITDATVTIHGLTSTTETITDSLTAYILDNPPLGFFPNRAAPGVDHFQGHGFALWPDYRDKTPGKEKLTFHLNDLNDPASWVWSTFTYPFEFRLADSTSVPYSSSLLELIDYAGNGTPFGLGFTAAPGNLLWSMPRARLFNGQDDFVEVPITDWDPDQGTVSLRFFANDLSSSRYLFGHTLGSWTNRIQLYIIDGSLGLGLGDSHFKHTDIAAIQPEQWYHAALTWDNNEYKVFVDGIEEASGAYSGLSQLNTFADIGNTGSPAWRNQEAFNGSIKDVRIYSRTLDSDEVFRLYQPDPNDITSFAYSGISFDLTVNSFEGDPNQYVLTYTYGQPGQPPVLDVLPTQTISEGSPLAFTVKAADPDDDPVTITADNLPVGAAFKSGTFTWSPSYDFTIKGTARSQVVTFTASDGTLSASRDVTIQVLDRNRRPVLNPIGPRSVNEGATLAFPTPAADPDGDQLQYVALRLPQGASYHDGFFTWTPGYDQAGTYNVWFIVRDASDPDWEYVDIIVKDVNRPPVLDPIGPKEVNEGSLLSFTLTGRDPDGNQVSFGAPSLPTGARLENNTFTWTPGYNQEGIYYVLFIARDGLSIDVEYVRITVRHTNQPPALAPILPKIVYEGLPLTFAIAALDPDSDAIMYDARPLPSGAAFANGTFTWTPGYDQAGTYDILFIVRDGFLTDARYVRITVLDAAKPVVLPGIMPTDPNSPS